MPFDQYPAVVWVLVAGASGAVFRVATAEALSRRQIVCQLIAGTVMAIFVAPWIVEQWLGDASDVKQRALAFLVGAAGPLTAEVALRVFERRGEKIAERLINRVIRLFGFEKEM